MLAVILNFLIYFAAYSYTLTTAVNFFHPITPVISFIILPCSLIFSILSTKYAPFNQFCMPAHKSRVSFLGVFVCLIIFLWFIIVINRLSRDTDLNIYYLPTALLMNHSIWYPGIGMLSLVVAFQNGTSILASLFTAFGIPGLEFIPGFCIWIIFGMAIYLYLLKKKIKPYICFVVATTLILAPRLFWESYNMGTDMPMACFLAIALFALSDRNFKDAALFFAMASAFKPLGQAAYGMFMAGYFFFLLFRRSLKELLDFKIILSIVLFLAVSTRLYIATGNPIYPAIPINLAPWGMAIEDQMGIISNARSWHAGFLVNYQNSFIGITSCIKDFFVFPNRVNSSYWFSPFFLLCLFSACYLFIRDKRYKNMGLHIWTVAVLVCIFIISWAFTVPQMRFVLGPLIFITVIFFAFSIKAKLPLIFKGLIYLSLFFTLACFGVNVKRHFKVFIIPMLGLSLEESNKFLPYDVKNAYTTVTMADGFKYTVSKSGYCGRSKPPCMHAYTVDDRNTVIKGYKEYNKRFLTRK